MYEGWKITPWHTPVSGSRNLIMISFRDELHDDGGELVIVLEDADTPERICWQLKFDRYPAYRNILEEFRLELWQHLDESHQRCGSTFIVAESPWIASFRECEQLLETVHPTLAHYVIATQDDVVEVLSPDPPTIMKLTS